MGKGCGASSEGFPDPKCPDILRFSHNLVGLPNNGTALLFEGNFRPNATVGRSFSFDSNLYWSEAAATDLATAPVFGGASWRVDHNHHSQHTWAAWREMGNDVAGALGDPRFADPRWAQPPFNVTLRRDSPAPAGWRQIDTSEVGVLPRNRL